MSVCSEWVNERKKFMEAALHSNSRQTRCSSHGSSLYSQTTDWWRGASRSPAPSSRAAPMTGKSFEAPALIVPRMVAAQGAGRRRCTTSAVRRWWPGTWAAPMPACWRTARLPPARRSPPAQTVGPLLLPRGIRKLIFRAVTEPALPQFVAARLHTVDVSIATSAAVQTFVALLGRS